MVSGLIATDAHLLLNSGGGDDDGSGSTIILMQTNVYVSLSIKT